MLENEINNILEQTCLNRAFELEAAKGLDEGIVNPPIYLSIGTEHIPPLIKTSLNCEFKLFAQHRCHSYFLTMGGDAESLAKELMGRPDGCNQGMGGSASVSLPNMFGHSGLLGDQIPIATGYADASQELTVCVFGDAAAEEDYALSSFGYAATRQCPIVYICEDNDLSILTPKKTRRSWHLATVAQGFGIESHVVYDHELHVIHELLSDCNKPILLNVHCCRHRWHAGTGTDGNPKWDTYAILNKSFPQMEDYQEQANIKMKELWTSLR